MSTVLVPMKVDCFVFNEAVCNGGRTEAKIAPITQPDYALLQYDNRFLASDIMRHVDLHAASPASTNMRFTDLGTNQPHRNRQGVYVHWTLPRPYRVAAAQTEKSTSAGLPPGTRLPSDKPGTNPDANPIPPTEKKDPTVPTFYDVPPRWLVVRCLDENSIQPREAKMLVPLTCAWIVESDHMRSIDELDQDVDVQVDVSPYVAPGSDSSGKLEVDMGAQAEIFIGRRYPAEKWAEDTNAKRVRLNLFNSSNQLFADYQPHNGNVFSMLDRFEYCDAKGTERYLTAGKASYYVIGWQPDVTRDLFVPPAEKPAAGSSVRESRLRSLNMVLAEADDSQDTKDWKQVNDAARTLCHGAMYDVDWDAGRKPLAVPADESCAQLNGESALSVGMTPMDAIMAYVAGHSESSTGDMHQLEMNLLKIQTFLLDRDEDVEPQRRAANMMHNLNFQRQEGGKKSFLSNPNDKANNHSGTHDPIPHGPQKAYEPKQEEIDTVAAMNEKHRQIDSASRLLKKFQWDLFASWWELLTDVDASSRRIQYKTARTTLVENISSLHDKIKQIEEKFNGPETRTSKVQAGTAHPFYQAGDPTVLVAGVQSGWPVDFLDPLKVRLRHQIIGAVKDGKPVQLELPKYLDDVAERIDEAWRSDIKLLLSEFIILGTDLTEGQKPVAPSSYPLYHDLEGNSNGFPVGDSPKQNIEQRWRDRWHGTQPWAPLFLEWEVDYYHVDYNHWSLDDGDLTINAAEGSKARYRIDSDRLTESDLKDARKLSGRVLLLPQPSFSLKSKLEQFFDATPAPLIQKYLPGEDPTSMLRQVGKFKFLSAPLAGFIDHLITRQGGTHVKPTYRQPAEEGNGAQLPRAIPGAKLAASQAEYTDVDLELMGLETDLTPYGTAIPFSKTKKNPFKPATHGQFCFSKLNIIDKFGQAIHAVNPSVKDASKAPNSGNGQGRPEVYTSEYLRAQKLTYRPGDDAAPRNRGDSSRVKSEFVQIPPQINQFARLNAEFVILREHANLPGVKRPPYWKPASEWEQPVWGWVMINYANYSLQFFTSDGAFYREVRYGGPTGSMTSPNWMPHQSKGGPKQDADIKQLQCLLDRLADRACLQAFINMVNGAMRHMLPAPSAFAEFTSSLVGQPLALVNMGWSIELAVEAYTSHASLGSAEMAKRLTPDPQFEEAHTPREQLYSFQVKLGDETKAYDGLVGYWKGLGSPEMGNALDLDTLFTYYVDEGHQKGPAKKSDHSNFPRLYPYYLDPKSLESFEYELQHSQKLQVFGAVIDPFTAVHGYSSILPVRELKLSPWMWQKALRNMTAFFHMGPLLISSDITGNSDEKLAEGDVKAAKIKLPSNSLAQWDWLQPVHNDKKKYPSSVEVQTFDVGPVDERLRFEPGPYTAIEGYLHLRASAESEQNRTA